MNSKIFLCGLVLGLAVWSCAPPCENVASPPRTVCHHADAGAVAADAPFVLHGETFARTGSCSVSVDGGQINLSMSVMACAGSSSDRAAVPAQPGLVPCNVPALAAGSYTVNSSTPVTFTIPEAVDGGLPRCP